MTEAEAARSAAEEAAFQRGFAAGLRAGLREAERITVAVEERLWSAERAREAMEQGKVRTAHHVKGGHFAALGIRKAIRDRRLEALAEARA